MSNYTKTTDFAAKDSLPSGHVGKVVKGTEIDTEFNNIAIASATKANANNAALTGTSVFETLSDGTLSVTGWVDEDNMASNSNSLIPTQQSVKAYVDSNVTAQDLDVTDGSSSIDIDLDSESLGILGGTGVTSTASGTGVTLAIDSTVATLTGSQTLTNKTLTTPTILTSFTIGSATITEAELEILDGATVTTAELNVLDGITSTTAELNILDGVTSTAVELNILDGVTATTAELNHVDGVTSNIQTQINTKAPVAGATFTGTTTIPTADINGGAIDGTVIGGSTAAAGSFTTVAASSSLTIGGVTSVPFEAADHSKLDGIEASADVTDATNVTAAGALMDSEVTNLAQVKAFASSDYATSAQGTTADAALPKTGGAMTGAITTNSTFDGRDVATDGTKLDGIEASADVTDAANVTAAGALMDSELTSIASVKAMNQGVATSDSPTFAGITTSGITNTANLKISGAQGTDGQILTSTGSGVAWEDAAGGGGAWNVISSQTISSAASSVQFTSGITGYKNYVLVVSDFTLSASNQALSMQCARYGVGTTSTFLTSNGYYKYMLRKANGYSGNGYSSVYTTFSSYTQFVLAENIDDDVKANGEIRFASGSSTIKSEFAFKQDGSGAIFTYTTGYMDVAGDAAIVGIKLYNPNGNNISTGTFTLYGLANS